MHWLAGTGGCGTNGIGAVKTRLRLFRRTLHGLDGDGTMVMVRGFSELGGSGVYFGKGVWV